MLAAHAPYPGSIQKKILVITLSCLLGMCVVISLVSYYVFQNYLQRSLIGSTETSLQLLTDSIDSHMDDVSRMVQFCQTNPGIATYIASNPNPGSVLSVATYDRIYEEYSNNPSKNYLYRVAIVTNDNFLQIVAATASSTSDLAAEVPELPYFETLLNDPGYNFSPGILKDPFHRKGKDVLPLIRPITYQFSSVQGGYLFLEISTDLFSDALRRYAVAEDSLLYLTIGDHTYLYGEGDLQETFPSFQYRKDLTSAAIVEGSQIAEISDSQGINRLVVTVPLDMPGCYISQSISLWELRNQRLLLFCILGALLVSVLGIGTILMVVLNRMIHIPVSRIRSKMLRVAEGDFSRDPSIEWNHELGEIGRGINDLSENVIQLMNRMLQEEKEKQELEYRMLQSQVNPHFVYNTLNSIKWMATIQNATGIAEMTTALARLMKNVSKGTAALIPLQEELDLVKDYFLIQQYRYGGNISIEYQIEDPTLYQCRIHRFTLQPIIENAMFHGIEPKGCAGKIIIRAEKRTAGDSRKIFLISVTDNGIGMTGEMIKKVLAGDSRASADFFRHVGISNVNKRIQYDFGEDYGITIDSVPGEYTTMNITLPFQQLTDN